MAEPYHRVDAIPGGLESTETRLGRRRHHVVELPNVQFDGGGCAGQFGCRSRIVERGMDSSQSSVGDRIVRLRGQLELDDLRRLRAFA